jgi:hypothetical protein
MIGEGDCGEIGGMKIGKGNRSTRRKPASAPLCPQPELYSVSLLQFPVMYGCREVNLVAMFVVDSENNNGFQQLN